MARVIDILNASKYRILMLDDEIGADSYKIAEVGGASFDAITPTMTRGGMRENDKQAVAIVANNALFPDSFFIGKQVTVS